MIKMKIGFTVWICDESHSTPNRCRSMDSACTIHDEKFCCHNAQKIATNGTGIKTLNKILSVSLLKISLAYGRKPAGGIWTNFFRPIQKKIVARTMKTPGKPNARTRL